MLYSEQDYTQRIGMIILDSNEKEILINYFINFFLRLEFICLFLINSVIFYYNKNKYINVFYLFFLSTIIATLLFVTISNIGIDHYHFNNWIITSGVLYLILSIYYYLDNFLINHYKKKEIFFKFISFIFAFLIILQINFNFYKNDYKSCIGAGYLLLPTGFGDL